MSLILRLASRLARALNNLLGNVTEAVTEGVSPKENVYAVHANVEWGKQWIIAAVETLLYGGKIRVTTVDVVMLVIFIASTVIARRIQATSVTMPSRNMAT